MSGSVFKIMIFMNAMKYGAIIFDKLGNQFFLLNKNQ